MTGLFARGLGAGATLAVGLFARGILGGVAPTPPVPVAPSGGGGLGFRKGVKRWGETQLAPKSKKKVTVDAASEAMRARDTVVGGNDAWRRLYEENTRRAAILAAHFLVDGEEDA